MWHVECAGCDDGLVVDLDEGVDIGWFECLDAKGGVALYGERPCNM